MAMGVQSQTEKCFSLECSAAAMGKETSEVKRTIQFAGLFILLVLGPLVQASRAQLQVGDDLKMNLSGQLLGGYSASYGDQLPSNHSMNFGGDAVFNGSYYSPNFLNFSINPYFNQSQANSSAQSLTDSSGVSANVNLFSGSRFPAYANFNYTRDSTGTFGIPGSPSFTTVGDGHGFGVGWSALIPNWPTFSVNYSQGAGTGNIFGTNEESRSSTHTLNMRSTYTLAGWLLNAQYTYLKIDSDFPFFLGGETGINASNYSGNDFGINGTHKLPWNGNLAITFNHSTYSGNYGSDLEQTTQFTNYTTNIETANAIFHPTAKLGLYINQSYIDNLNGYLYQNISSNGGGVPLVPVDSQSYASTVSGGASYTFTKNIYGAAQLTYFHQAYLGNSYDGTYVTGTVGYNKRILDTFTVSASVVESSSKFANNSLGFVGNLNGFRRLGSWELSGGLSYAQNVQTLLVTYTTSYYNYNANLHRRLGRGMQWTGAFNGTHTGFSQYLGTVNQSQGFSTSLALRRLAFSANYIDSKGQSLLTSTGIQPIPPTPGLSPEGLIVYNGKSYGAGISATPLARLTISGNYSHAMSDTLSDGIFSNNKTEIFYGQFQYRMRKISLLGGFTKFSQGISAAGTPTGNQYSYFVGVTRWFNFF
jgi:hypothetical protein